MDVVVKTRSGDVRGSLVEGVNTFKGIPYAAAPFGANCFRPPQPVEPWSGRRDALNYGATVPKFPYSPPLDSLLPEPVIPGIDCLNLNIWSLELGGAKLPVMVWIHGGAFSNGTGALPIYDGSRFARDGVVCVTINYRLGISGFLYFGEGNANFGLLDQIAALTWVQKNIAVFGGDPGNVTIFGESAGGMSVSTLLAMPLAAGLFQRAIAQSGAGHHAISTETALRVSRYLAMKLDVELSQAAMAEIPVERLLQAQAELSADIQKQPDPQLWGEILANIMPFEPVVEGDILPNLPIACIAAGAGANVDIMAGTNTEEFRLFLVPSGVINHVTELAVAGVAAGYGLPVEAALLSYRAASPNASPGDLLSAISTDWFFRIPAIRLAEAYAQRSTATYMYEFASRSPQFNGLLGACHALEIPFVFDTLDKVRDSEGLWGTTPPQPLADRMHAAWVAFAHTGNPGWPQYELGRRTTMRFDTTSELVDDPRAAERALWEGIR